MRWPNTSTPPPAAPPASSASLATVAREWTRIGVLGFGGPPAHIALLRRLVVERRGWLDAEAFQDANAACGLLPGPASTQLAIFCAYRVAGPGGALAGGLGFILPGLLAILGLSVLFLGGHPPLWVRGAGAGAGAASAAVALAAAQSLVGPSFARVRDASSRRLRWGAYLCAGLAGTVALGPFLVLVLLGCGAVELIGRRRGSAGVFVPAAVVVKGAWGALAWTAFKVGALSFGGGFVIVPLIQGDAVHTYHWMSEARFLDAVVLGQVTPGPVVATVAAVGYAAHGVLGWLLAGVVVFVPSFIFILVGGRRFEALRHNASARAFLDGAGPAAIGAILGAAVVLAGALHHGWQFAVLAAAVVAAIVLRRGPVLTLVGAGAVGVLVALCGAGVG